VSISANVPLGVAPLDGLEVVDLSSGLAGAYATKLLADAGAAVTLVEPSTGHPLRRWSASGARLGEGADGALFRFLAAGKRSVTADAGRSADVEAVLALVERSGVVVWSPGSPLADRPRLHPDQLRREAPGAVVVAVSPFGLTGPWADRPATEFTVQALAGGVAHRGPVDRPPLAIGGQHGEWVAGVFATVGALVALHRQALSGEGELVDVSMFEALIMTPHFNSITYQSISGEPYFVGRRPSYPGDIEPTADGYVGFALVNTLQPWLDFCALIGHDDWAEDVSTHNPGQRAERYDEMVAEIRRWTTARTTAEIVEVASALRIPVAPIGHGGNVAAMDHFAAGGFHQRSAEGDFLQPSPPFRFGGERPPEVGRPAPRLGPPIGAATTGPAAAAPRGAALRSSPRSTALPFEGLRIVDLTAFWAGPFATHVLAMLGAEVLHVESTVRLDGARSIIVRTAPRDQWWEWSHAFQGVSTNKDGLAIDLSAEAGRAVLRDLIATADVVVENYSPRVLENWGLDEAGLRDIRPDLVVVRMPAFGLRGPWRDRTGFAMTMEQVSGLAWLTGHPDGPPTTLLGPCDPVGGAYGTIGLLLALEHRRRTGEGLLVEVPMVAGALNLAAEQVIEHSAYGALLQREGNRSPAAAPQNLYETADPPDERGEPRRVAISVAGDQQWSALRRALGDPAWAGDARYGSHAGRRAAHDELDGHLAAWCAARTSDEVVERLWNNGVPVAPVLTNGEQAGLAQLQARSFLEEVDHAVTGRSLHTTYPVRFSGGPDRWHRRPAPTLGRDNRDVLGRILGMSGDELDALERAGVIGTTPAT
jgi:crotonobetainyl-CoA:carnitine CoA-transferase CaiB-like acyl-CoA transferase